MKNLMMMIIIFRPLSERVELLVSMMVFLGVIETVSTWHLSAIYCLQVRGLGSMLIETGSCASKILWFFEVPCWRDQNPETPKALSKKEAPGLTWTASVAEKNSKRLRVQGDKTTGKKKWCQFEMNCKKLWLLCFWVWRTVFHVS